MFNKIDFNNVTPYFINGDFKWYIDEYFSNYITNKQAFNLPKLNGLACFIVKGDDIEEYVLIDNKQNIISVYPYSINGLEQMITKINIIKIAKYFEENEKSDV